MVEITFHFVILSACCVLLSMLPGSTSMEESIDYGLAINRNDRDDGDDRIFASYASVRRSSNNKRIVKKTKMPEERRPRQKTKNQLRKNKRTNTRLIDSSMQYNDGECGLSSNELAKRWDPNPPVVLSKRAKLTKPHGKRVIGGGELTQGEFPWLAHVTTSYTDNNGVVTTVKCVANIISKDYLLSARSRWCDFKEKISEIRTGLYDLNKAIKLNEPVRRVKKLFPYKSMNEKLAKGDLVLIKVDIPFKWSDNVRPICLPSSPDPANKMYVNKVTIAGWGHSAPKQDDLIYLSKPRAVIVKLKSHSQCENKYSDQSPYDPSFMHCSFEEPANQDVKNFVNGACNEDLGGPALIAGDNERWRLFGIITESEGSCDESEIGLTKYVKVEMFVEWILSVIIDMPEDPLIDQLDSSCGLNPMQASLRQTNFTEGKPNEIARGYVVQVGEVPWFAYITSEEFSCGGTIISKDFILTAGHCNIKSNGNVTVGFYDFKNPSPHMQIRHIAYTIPYPGYDFSTFMEKGRNNSIPDAALIKLARPLEWNSYVRPACLPSSGFYLKPGDSLTMTGLGVYTWYDGPKDGYFDSSKLTAAAATINDYKDCVERGDCVRILVENSTFINETACSGDSGGPVLHETTGPEKRWFVYGVIIESVPDCAVSNTAFLYVAYIREWIYNTVMKNSNDP